MREVDEKEPSCTDEGSGLPLVFVHGFPLNRHCWRPQVENLSSSCRTIAPDLRGFGGPQGGPEMTTMDRFASDIASILEELGTGPVVLVGHSMGGYVALAFARSHPEKLRGLVLVCTRSGQDSPEVAAGRRATAERVRQQGIEEVVDAMVPKMLAPGNRNGRSLEAVRDLMTSASRDGVIGALLGMAARRDATPDLDEISVPTLVVTGAQDEVIDAAESKSLAQAISGARLSVIPAAGHLVAWERPEAFSRVLSDWLGEAGLLGGSLG